MQVNLPFLCTPFNHSTCDVYPGFALFLYFSFFIKTVGFQRSKLQRMCMFCFASSPLLPQERLVNSIDSFLYSKDLVMRRDQISVCLTVIRTQQPSWELGANSCARSLLGHICQCSEVEQEFG